MLSEVEETFTVTLGTITSGLSDRVSVATSTASATIAESDPITIELSGPATVAEGSSAEYTVGLSPAGVTPTADLSVDYATSDGTATAGSDYTASSGTLTFTQARAPGTRPSPCRPPRTASTTTTRLSARPSRTRRAAAVPLPPSPAPVPR